METIGRMIIIFYSGTNLFLCSKLTKFQADRMLKSYFIFLLSILTCIFCKAQFLPLPLDSDSAFWNYAFTTQNSIGEEHLVFRGPGSNIVLDGKTYSPLYTEQFQTSFLGSGEIDTQRISFVSFYMRCTADGKIFQKEASGEVLFFDVNALEIGDTIPSDWGILYSTLNYSVILLDIDTLLDNAQVPHRKFIFHIPQNPYLTDLYFVDGIGCSASFGSFIPYDLESPMYDLGCASINGEGVYPSAGFECRNRIPAPFSSTETPHTVSMSIYPNPTAGPLQLRWEGQHPAHLSLQVSDLTGLVVFKKDNPSFPLDLSSLPSGFYFLSVFSSNANFVRTLRIEK